MKGHIHNELWFNKLKEYHWNGNLKLNRFVSLTSMKEELMMHLMLKHKCLQEHPILVEIDERFVLSIEKWTKINDKSGVWIVRYNEHYFILKVDSEAFYLINLLGYKLHEKCESLY